MQSHLLRSSIAYMLNSKARFEPFLAPVFELSQYAAGLDNLIAVAAEQGGEVTNHVRKHLANTGQVLSKVILRNFYKAHEAFEEELEDLWSPTLGDPGALPPYHAKLTEEMDEFLVRYNSYLTNQNPQNAFQLLVSARKLQPQIDATFELLDAVRHSLEPDVQSNKGEAELALYLPSQMGVRDFAARLQALQSLYSKMCELLDVSELDHPLRIAEMESGSLWLKVFGDEKVLGFISAFIAKAAQWGFQNYTREGRLGSFPRKVESVEAVLNLTEKLKDAGIDVSAAQENIRNATVTLSKDLETLIANQASVTVNDQTLKLSDEMQRQSSQALSLSHEIDRSVGAATASSPLLPRPSSTGKEQK